MGQYFEIWNIVNMMEHIEALKVHQTDLMMWCWSQIESNYHSHSTEALGDDSPRTPANLRSQGARTQRVCHICCCTLLILSSFLEVAIFPTVLLCFFRRKHRGLKKILVKPPDLRSETEVEEVWEAKMVSVVRKRGSFWWCWWKKSCTNWDV